MNKEIRQILENQRTLLHQFHSKGNRINLQVNERIIETNELLNQTKSKELLTEMPEEVKNGN